MTKLLLCLSVFGLVACAGTKEVSQARSPDQVDVLNCQSIPFTPPANREGLLTKQDVIAIACEAMRRAGLSSEHLTLDSALNYQNPDQHTKFLLELKYAVNSFVKRDDKNMIGAYYNLNLDFSSYPAGTNVKQLLESVIQEQRVVYAEQDYYMKKVEPNAQRALLTPQKLKEMKNREAYFKQQLELKKMKQKGQIN